VDSVFQVYSEKYGKKLDLSDDFCVSYDTSTILDLYRLSEKSRAEVLLLIDKIGVRVNHFLTHYVAFEISNNKEKAKKDFDNKLDDIRGKFSSFKKSLNGNVSAGGYSTPFYELSRDISESLALIHGLIEKKAISLKNSSDFNSLFDRISSIFSQKVFDPFSKEELEEIVGAGGLRYKAKIPPGFSDDKKTDVINFFGVPIEAKYGDLIIWEQLIAWANREKKSIIFITSDQKPDWISLRKIRTDLAAEFNNRTGFCIYTYTLSEFESNYKKYLGSKLSESSKTELEIIEGEYDNWLDELIGAFEVLDRDVSLNDLYLYIRNNTGRTLSVSWESTVRRTIYYHSSDVGAYQGKRDVFQRVGSERSGIWRLR
jgi:hypothetical protein